MAKVSPRKNAGRFAFCQIITITPTRITPAPRKPMPVTICAATRPESPVVVVKTNETIVKVAEPKQTSTSVRRPAGFSLRSRSVPTSAPHSTATSASTIGAAGLPSRGHQSWTRISRMSTSTAEPLRRGSLRGLLDFLNRCL